MNRYPSYKPSGVKWLGEIPSHWEVIKTSHLFTHIGSGTTPKSGSEEYYTEDGIPFLQTGDLNDGFIVDTSKKITEKALRDTNLTIYLQGSLVIAMYGATIGKLGILGIDTTVNQACCVLPKSPKVETRFAFYAYLAAKNDLIFQSKGGGQPNISQDTIKNERIPVPSRAEQTAIANYLDAATAKIDAAIAQQQKMIDLLNERKQIIINRAVTKGLNPNAKMKDSGVEWIGEVPEGWEVRKLKHIFRKISDGTHFSPNTISEGYPYITATDVNGKGIDYDLVKRISAKDYEVLVASGCKIEKGDILLVKDGATTGRVGMKTDEVSCVALSSVAMLTPSRKDDNNFLMYVMMSDVLKKQIDLSMAGAAMPRITLVKLSNFICALPSYDEQVLISNYIESKIQPIEDAIIAANNQISLLQERKQIIINEVVTGKVKVV